MYTYTQQLLRELVCEHACTGATKRVRVYARVLVPLNIYIHTYIRAHAHARAHTRTRTHTHARTRTHAHTRTHTPRTHARTHTHINKYIFINYSNTQHGHCRALRSVTPEPNAPFLSVFVAAPRRQRAIS